MASPPPYTTGTVTLKHGSAEIEGNGTAWLLAGVRGGIMTVEAVGNALTLASVDSDTAATAATKWTGPDGTYAYAISMASADAADTIWASRHWSRVVGNALLAGIVPVASGTLAERDALDPQPANGEWFAHAEPPYDLTFYRKVPAGWEGPYQFRGDAGQGGEMGPGLVPLGAWSGGATYARGDYVHHDGRTFVSRVNDNTGNEPPAAAEDNSAWMWVPAPQGAAGPTGDGWAAVLALVADGVRRVYQVSDWIGGTGPKPATGMFIGPAGYVETAAEAVDVRGPAGTGDGDVAGPDGGVTDGHVAVFDGTTGKIIKSAGKVPFSGSYVDLDDKPTLGDLSEIDLPSEPDGKLLDDRGNWVDPPESGGYDPNMALLALEMADLKGGRMGMVGGVADPFDDESGVNAGASSNYEHDDVNHWFEPRPDDLDTLVLLHFDGVDGSSVVVDSSGYARSVTPGSTFEIDDTQSKFGGTSGRFLGTAASRLTVANNGDFTFGTGDFTIEFWMRFNSIANFNSIMDVSGYANGVEFIPTPTEARVYIVNTTSFVRSFSWATGTWYHIAIVRSGGMLSVFVDGAQLGAAASHPQSLNGAGAVTVGGRASGYFFNGWMDDLRISNVARYSSNFTPPAAPYPDPGYENMTLASVAYPAASEPSLGRVAVQLVEDNPITINDDVTAEISRDGGTTWSTATLALVSSLDSLKLYEDASIDLSGQPAGDDVVWRVTTDNNVNVAVSGVVAQWR